MQIKREIKNEYIVPLRESVVMLNRLVPDCDLTIGEDEGSDIETINLIDESEQPAMSNAAIETIPVQQQSSNAMEVEPCHEAAVANEVDLESAASPEEHPLDDFSGDLLFETDPVIFVDFIISFSRYIFRIRFTVYNNFSTDKQRPFLSSGKCESGGSDGKASNSY